MGEGILVASRKKKKKKKSPNLPLRLFSIPIIFYSPRPPSYSVNDDWFPFRFPRKPCDPWSPHFLWPQANPQWINYNWSLREPSYTYEVLANKSLVDWLLGITPSFMFKDLAILINKSSICPSLASNCCTSVLVVNSPLLIWYSLDVRSLVLEYSSTVLDRDLRRRRAKTWALFSSAGIWIKSTQSCFRSPALESLCSCALQINRKTEKGLKLRDIDRSWSRYNIETCYATGALERQVE